MTQNIIVPYIPRRWAILRLPANSEVVRTSLATVLITTDTFFPALTVLVACFFAFFAFSKKYLTFFLMNHVNYRSYYHQNYHRNNKSLHCNGRYKFRKLGKWIDSNQIMLPLDFTESQIASNIFSIVGIIDQPLYKEQFVTSC